MKKDSDKNNLDKKSKQLYGQKRSSKFDDIFSSPSSNINQGQTPTKKVTFKKVLKWIFILIYTYLGMLIFLGLIQSCTLKSSSTVGAGIEIYKNKNDIAPYVNTYQIVEKTKEEIQYDQNGQPIVENGKIKKIQVKYYALEANPKDNYLADQETIKTIKSQLNVNYNKEVSNLYGAYNNKSSSIRILNLDLLGINDLNNSLLKGNIKIDGQDGIIFLSDQILDYLNKNNIEYKPINVWDQIRLFVVNIPENFDLLTPEQKDVYGIANTNINNSFQPYEKIGNNYVKIKYENNSYFSKDIDGDGIIDSNEYVEIKDEARIAKFVYKFDAQVATLESQSTKLLNSERFARDYIQAFNNIVLKFGQLKSFYDLINNVSPGAINATASGSEISSQIAKVDFALLMQTNKYLTMQQKNAILNYQSEMLSLMQTFGFGIRNQVFSDENSEDYVTTKQPFKIEYNINLNNKKSIIIGQNTIEQKPITSWSEAWSLGPFYGTAVWPISYLINSLMYSMPKISGWEAIITIVLGILITRIFITAFTYKSLFVSHKQQMLNPKKAKIDAKYEPFKGNKEMEQRKRQEIAKLYKANNLKVSSTFKAMCISVPVFLAVWRVIQGIPLIKTTTWLGIQFSLTSWKELFNGAWQYLPLLIFAAGTQLVAQLLPKFLNRKRMKERSNKAEQEALKKANRTQNFVSIAFVFISVIFEAGVQVYWIIGGLWQIMQVLVVDYIVKSNWYRTKGHKYV